MHMLEENLKNKKKEEEKSQIDIDKNNNKNSSNSNMSNILNNSKDLIPISTEFVNELFRCAMETNRLKCLKLLSLN